MSETVGQIAMTLPHVGGFIREEILEPLSLPVGRAAELLGVPESALLPLVEERDSLSPEMALRVEKAFGVNMDLLLKMQAGYEAARMRQHAADIRVDRYVPSAA